MQRAITERLPERAPTDYAIYDPAQALPVVGKVVARGLSDEHADRQYLIVDGVDGLSPCVDIGIDAPATPDRRLVRVAPTRIHVRAVDRTVVEIAAAHDGLYSVDLHLQHDPSASEAFAKTHVRRLEAIRRGTAGVERRPDGSWAISADHLARVEVYERARAKDKPVAIEILSDRPLAELVRHDGATWLARELTSANPIPTGRGYGAEE